jgi:hypothetical protein
MRPLPLSLVLACALTTSGVTHAADDKTFTEGQRTQIRGEITAALNQAKNYAKVNQRYDIGFKVALLIITIAATCGAAYAGTYSAPESPPRWLKIAGKIGVSPHAAILAAPEPMKMRSGAW